MEKTILSTARCTLRPVDQGDIAGIFELRSDERMCRYVDRIPIEYESEAKDFISKIVEGSAQGSWQYWAILAGTESQEFVGVLCLWNFSEQLLEAEIGYELLPRFQGSGLVTEVVVAVVQFAFDRLRLRKIIGVCHIKNTPSIKVLQRAGFHFVSDLPLSMVKYAIEK